MELWQIILLFVVGSIAGMINVMAGGGSTLTLPTLIFLGLDGAMANGTNRIAIFIQNISAIASFHNENVHRFRESLKLALWTLPGTIIGALAAVRISDEWFQKILGIVLIGVVVSMLVSPNNAQHSNITQKQTRFRRLMVYPALFLVGFYGGFIQVGIGFLLMSILYHLLRLDLLMVNMHKVFIVLVYTLPALAIFIWSGNVNWPLGLSLAAGNSFGAWWAAKLSVKKGDKFIKYFLFFAVCMMAAKLLGII
jgi:hypothetical protein